MGKKKESKLENGTVNNEKDDLSSLNRVQTDSTDVMSETSCLADPSVHKSDDNILRSQSEM